jgi:hypothetical protein
MNSSIKAAASDKLRANESHFEKDSMRSLEVITGARQHGVNFSSKQSVYAFSYKNASDC